MIDVAVALIRDKNQRWLCCQRGTKEAHAGYWEFPGGKFEADEMLSEAMVREINEELAIDLSGLDIETYQQLSWQHPGKLVRLHAGIVVLKQDVLPKLTVHQAYRWLETAELRELSWLESNIPFVMAIQKDYR